MSYLARNNSLGKLAASIASNSVSLTLKPGEGDRFPVVTFPDITKVTIEDAAGNREIVKVTGRVAASDIFTIERGQEGTVARSWSIGDVVELRMTAELVQTAMAHPVLTSGAHAAAAIVVTPTGSLLSINVQAALVELSSREVLATGFKTASTTVNTSAAAAPVAGQVLTAVSATQSAWVNAGLPLTGGTMSGAITSNVGSMLIGAASGAIRGHVYNDTSGIGFLSNAATWALRVNFGTVDLSAMGSFTASGNVTAYSDERVKTNWRPLDRFFIERLASVKCGIYDRTDNDLTQVGVSAQSLRYVMPEAVIEDQEGRLSVAYGNAALAACIELAKRVVALENQLKLIGTP